jgi:hypothetical protein
MAIIEGAPQVRNADFRDRHPKVWHYGKTILIATLAILAVGGIMHGLMGLPSVAHWINSANGTVAVGQLLCIAVPIVAGIATLIFFGRYREPVRVIFEDLQDAQPGL